MKRTINTLILTFALTIFAVQTNAQTAISTEGMIESKSGGFKFPDGTEQNTATPGDLAERVAQLEALVAAASFSQSLVLYDADGDRIGTVINFDDATDVIGIPMHFPSRYVTVFTPDGYLLPLDMVTGLPVHPESSILYVGSECLGQPYTEQIVSSDPLRTDRDFTLMGGFLLISQFNPVVAKLEWGPVASTQNICSFLDWSSENHCYVLGVCSDKTVIPVTLVNLEDYGMSITGGDNYGFTLPITVVVE
jgi:hypothetical protein